MFDHECMPLRYDLLRPAIKPYIEHLLLKMAFNAPGTAYPG
jgi:hypothetical protein